MPASSVRYPSALLALVSSLQIANAAVARTPSITGNGWAALGIIAFLIAVIWFVIMGALHVERRDATLGRAARDGGGDRHGWFGFTSDDDDDAPDGGSGNGNN